MYIYKTKETQSPPTAEVRLSYSEFVAFANSQFRMQLLGQPMMAFRLTKDRGEEEVWYPAKDGWWYQWKEGGELYKEWKATLEFAASFIPDPPRTQRVSSRYEDEESFFD